MGTKEHKKHAVKSVKIGIITLSTTRTLADDESGLWIKKQVWENGHDVIFHQVIPDNAEAITNTVTDVLRDSEPHALLLTGGTGVSPGDVTIEAVRPLFEKELTAFGALFAQLSYEEIGSAAVLSRAAAGVIGNTAVFCMPGSLKGCKLACTKLIFPELGHIAKHIRD
ncbi:MAG: MogA/MoaB family molybdenum cofactor biosynthesis protein [Desulfobacterales bacterium]|nr:MogA/MoaB family molybdenum cofactor biosynthesis protein [Desulfobacterales bacterium]